MVEVDQCRAVPPGGEGPLGASETGQVRLLEEVGSRARARRIEGGYLAGAGSGFAAEENEGRVD